MGVSEALTELWDPTEKLWHHENVLSSFDGCISYLMVALVQYLWGMGKTQRQCIGLRKEVIQGVLYKGRPCPSAIFSSLLDGCLEVSRFSTSLTSPWCSAFLQAQSNRASQPWRKVSDSKPAYTVFLSNRFSQPLQQSSVITAECDWHSHSTIWQHQYKSYS